MNITQSSLAFVLFAVMGTAGLTPAACANDGTRGGGEMVNYSNSRELRDLVDHTNCHWKQGWQVLLENPEINSYLDKIAVMDWYFASELRREIRSLDYCYTEHLSPINTEDRDHLTTTYLESRSQAGVRLNREVYVDQSVISPQLAKHTKAFFYIHEAMHSYLKMDLPQRNQKLRSSVETLFLVANKQLTSKADYRFQMKKNQVAFPAAVTELETVKNFGPLAFSEGEEQKTIFLRSKNLETLFQESTLLPSLLEYLTPWDQEQVNRLRFSQVIQTLLHDADPAIIAHLLQSNLKSVDAFAICLGTAEIQKDPLLMSKLSASVNGKQSRERFYHALSSKHVGIIDNRLSLNSDTFDLLAAGAKNIGSETVSASSLLPVTPASWDAVSPEAKAWVYLVGQLLKDDRTAELNEWIFSNAEFTQAFSLVGTLDSLLTLQAPIPREKTYAREALISTAEAFWIEALESISQTAGREKTEEFAKKINQLNLGYPVHTK